MSGGRMPTSPASASKGFSSTPVKSSRGKDLHISNGMDDGVLSEDDDTFSLLSPIYHDSFDSDEDPELSPAQQTSPHRQSKTSRLSVSPDREKEQKKIVMDIKIQEWLKMKRQQEKQEQLLKLSKEEAKIQRQQEKQKEIEQKAQQKYKDWLQKKNQEKIEKEKKDKEEAALKAEQERERHQRAEEKFKEWLARANEKSRANPKSPCHPKSPYDKSYPSPSFYNPIPWKPIPVPPPETSPNKTTDKKHPKQRKKQQSSSTAFRLRNTVNAAQSLQRR
eukprot:superscaffoldBa00000515_g5342